MASTKEPGNGGCKDTCNQCWSSKPKEEWIQLFASYGTFYLFMAGWMALHIGVMVEFMPAWQDDPRVFTQNGLMLSKPRVTRFFAHAINLANEAGDGEALNPTPWNDDEKPQTSIEATCTAGQACSARQQIRIQNAFALTYIGDVEIPIVCTAVEGNATFSDFTDPVATERTALDWKMADHSGSGLENSINIGLNKIETMANGFKVTFMPGASAPHIVEYSISSVLTVSNEVKVECTMPTKDEPAFEDAYCFDEPEDDIFELGVKGITELEYTAEFNF